MVVSRCDWARCEARTPLDDIGDSPGGGWIEVRGIFTEPIHLCPEHSDAFQGVVQRAMKTTAILI